jgi:hypothetical protein
MRLYEHDNSLACVWPPSREPYLQWSPRRKAERVRYYFRQPSRSLLSVWLSTTYAAAATLDLVDHDEDDRRYDTLPYLVGKKSI